MTDMQRKMLKMVGAKPSDTEPKKTATDTTTYITDEHGNRYAQTVVDGVVTLKLVEGIDGMLHE